MGPLFSTVARVAAFTISKETGIVIASILTSSAAVVTAVCTVVAQIIEAKNKHKKDDK